MKGNRTKAPNKQKMRDWDGASHKEREREKKVREPEKPRERKWEPWELRECSGLQSLAEAPWDHLRLPETISGSLRPSEAPQEHLGPNVRLAEALRGPRPLRGGPDGWTDRWMDGRMNRRTNWCTEGKTNRQSEPNRFMKHRKWILDLVFR